MFAERIIPKKIATNIIAVIDLISIKLVFCLKSKANCNFTKINNNFLLKII